MTPNPEYVGFGHGRDDAEGADQYQTASQLSNLPSAADQLNSDVEFSPVSSSATEDFSWLLQHLGPRSPPQTTDAPYHDPFEASQRSHDPSDSRSVPTEHIHTRNNEFCGNCAINVDSCVTESASPSPGCRCTLGQGQSTCTQCQQSLISPTTLQKNASCPSPLSITASAKLPQPNADLSIENNIAGGLEHEEDTPLGKTKSRFTPDTIKILKSWLLSHSQHPYPNEDDKIILQHQTGLSRTQILNWLANARRRGKTQDPVHQSTSISHGSAAPMPIPRRPGTPAVDRDVRDLSPIQRWVDSPPENEPASVEAIANAIAFNSEMATGISNSHSFPHNGPDGRICYGSYESSGGTSTGSSFDSAYSDTSHGSLRQVVSLKHHRGRERRKRRHMPRREPKMPLTAVVKPYQCTFCTDTFKKKYDWQRHEKSLHISLERWTCVSQGPHVINYETNQVCCVFCGKDNPDEAHIKSHSYSVCEGKPLEERSFYRKDHLNQHLRLVHGAEFSEERMSSWKAGSLETRSRCGFCGIVMENWAIRADHLAAHFTSGSTMADWKGDWGFEAPVLDMLENCIPPYLIENERNSPLPYIATRELADFRQAAPSTTPADTVSSPLRPTTPEQPLLSKEDTQMQHAEAVISDQPFKRGQLGFSARSLSIAESLMPKNAFFLNDVNCYRRVAQELTRFVLSTMSPNNPNCHVPTDVEIQHQARWVVFDSDDPWNQTVADNAEWLLRFKRDVGILPEGPGLGLSADQWNVSQGGTGFAPPYAFPNDNINNMLPATSTIATPVNQSANSNGQHENQADVYLRGRIFAADQTTIANYIHAFESRYNRPATIFCSRELELGLIKYVIKEMSQNASFPSDEALRAHARLVLASDVTAADDTTLLAKFKAWIVDALGQQ